MTDERKLLERAQAYDEAALGELYDRYAPQVYAYLYRRLHDVQLAQDLTGETFVRVLEAIRAERFSHTSFRGWLYRIAHNLVVDHYRRSPAVVELDEGLEAGPDDLEAADWRFSARRLRAALRRLTADQQQVLVLRFGQQWTAREIAEALGKSEGAVEALQHRALAAPRRILEE